MKYLGILLLLSGLGFTGWKAMDNVQAGGPAVAPSSLFTVARDSLKITVTENGYLKAKNSVKLKPKFERQGTITWLIEEGETVKEGDVLVEFDKTSLEEKIDDLKTSLIQYEMEFEAGEAELGIQERDNETVVEKAQLDLKLSELQLELFKLGTAPNELRKKELAKEKSVSEFERAKERFEQVPELAEEGFLTAIQVEEERIRLREAEINKENVTRELELYLEYTRPMEQTQRETDVKDAKRELENAHIKAAIKFKQKNAAFTQQKRQVDSTASRIAQLQEEMGNMTMVAPSQGLVHYGDPARPWYHDNIKIGESMHKGNVAITLPDLTVMQVLLQVHEADIDLVKLEMPVLVTIETHKGVSFPATVTEIATVASSSGWNDSSNKTFRVEVTMEVSELDMRAGVTARSEIQVDELADVLQVPIHAIHPDEDKHFCYVYADQKVQRREVSIGKNNAHRVEVLSGLEAGERVLLYDPRESEINRSDGESGGELPAASMGVMGGEE